LARDARLATRYERFIVVRSAAQNYYVIAESVPHDSQRFQRTRAYHVPHGILAPA